MDYKKIFSMMFILVLVLSNVNFVFSSTPPQTFGETIINGVDSYSQAHPSFATSGNANFIGDSCTILLQNSENSTEISFVPEGALLFQGSNNSLPYSLNFLQNFNNGGIINYTGTIFVDKATKKITRADVFVVNGQDYIFGNNNFYAPAGSRIIYANGFVKIDAPDNSTFTKLPSLLDPKSLIGGTEIKGKNIVLPDGTKIVDGKVNYGLKGILVEDGTVEYNNKLISVGNPSEQVLISNGIDSNPSGNWIRDNNGKLQIQSAKDGTVNMKFLPGEQNLNVKKGDNVLVQVKNGDGLEITQSPNKISKVLHKSSPDGTTSITNGKLGTLVYTKNDVQIKKGSLSFNGITSDPGATGSVATSITSDSKEIGLKILTTNYNELGMVSPNGEVATFNKDLAKNLKGFSYADLKKEYGDDWANVLDKQITPIMKNYKLNYGVAQGINKISLEKDVPIPTLATIFPTMRHADYSDKKSLNMLSKAYFSKTVEDDGTIHYNFDSSLNPSPGVEIKKYDKDVGYHIVTRYPHSSGPGFFGSITKRFSEQNGKKSISYNEFFQEYNIANHRENYSRAYQAMWDEQISGNSHDRFSEVTYIECLGGKGGDVTGLDSNCLVQSSTFSEYTKSTKTSPSK